MKRYVLCQDCLAVLYYSEVLHGNDDARCECGGDLCGCDNCQEHAEQIVETFGADIASNSDAVDE